MQLITQPQHQSQPRNPLFDITFSSSQIILLLEVAHEQRGAVDFSGAMDIGTIVLAAFESHHNLGLKTFGLRGFRIESHGNPG